jgi:hypothetical protein
LRRGKEIATIDNKTISLGVDIILSADNKTITNVIEFNNILNLKKVGDSLHLTILRDGQIKSVELKIEFRSVNFDDSSNYIDPEKIKFIPYNSFDNGVEILYPTNWTKDEDSTTGEDFVIFRSPYENKNDAHREYLRLSIYPISGYGIEDLMKVNTQPKDFIIITLYKQYSPF